MNGGGMFMNTVVIISKFDKKICLFCVLCRKIDRIRFQYFLAYENEVNKKG